MIDERTDRLLICKCAAVGVGILTALLALCYLLGILIFIFRFMVNAGIML